MDHLSDEVLMQCVARGQVPAFDLLFCRHRTAVYHFVLRMVGSPETAEDLTQECFLRVWRARQRYEPTARFRTWLFTIARRLALNELARCRRHPEQELSPLEEEFPSTNISEHRRDKQPEAALFTRELARLLERALERLPPDLKEVVILREMEEMSYQEIAAVLDCPVGTVKSRLNTARRRLRSLISGWWGEEAR